MTRSIASRLLAGVIAGVSIVALLTAPAQAVVYTYFPSHGDTSAVIFDSANTPTIHTFLAGGTLGGITFSPLGTITGTAGFGSFPSSPGSNVAFASLSFGVSVAGGPNAGLPSSLNLPNGNNGNTTRHGVEVALTPGQNGLTIPVMTNGTGADFVIFESGLGLNSGNVQAMIVRVRDAQTGQFSPWFYDSIDAIGPITSANMYVNKYDFSDFGIAPGGQVDLIQFANTMGSDRLENTSTGAKGFLDNTGGTVQLTVGTMNGWLSNQVLSTHDPDPNYLAVLHNLVEFVPVQLPQPEPQPQPQPQPQPGPAPNGSIPEPASAVLLTFASLALLRRNSSRT